MRRPKGTVLIIGLAVASLVSAIVRTGSGADAKGEVAAIRAAGKEYVTKLHRGNGDSLRTMWTRDGDYIDAAGQRTKASELFVDRPNVNRVAPDNSSSTDSESTIRIIAPGVAIEDGAIESEKSGDKSPAGRFMAVWVKQDGSWRIDTLREFGVAPVNAGDRLQSLGWLIGEWVAKTGDGAILVSSRWSDDGHYIVREFAEQSSSGAVSATQRIGWDAGTGTIKCWTFDSQGDVSTGTWRRDGNRWIVETTETLPDKNQVTTSSVYLPRDAGQFVWEVSGMKILGSEVPPRRLEFKRAVDK